MYKNERNFVRMLVLEENYTEAIKLLMKLRNTKDKPSSFEEEYFIIYNLAYCYNQLGRDFIAQYYVLDMKEIFKDEHMKKEHQTDYKKFIKLYIKINGNISNEESIELDIESYNYYKNLCRNIQKIRILTGMMLRSKDGQGLINLLTITFESFCQFKYIQKEILEACKQVDIDTYSKAVDLIFKHSVYGMMTKVN